MPALMLCGRSIFFFIFFLAPTGAWATMELPVSLQFLNLDSP
jgi:hypothetical protein